MKADDAKALKALRRKFARPDGATGEGDEASSVVVSAEKSRIPAKLIDELLAHKTLALRVAITEKPDLALRLVVFTLASRIVDQDSTSCLSIAVDGVDISRSITRSQSKAPETLESIVYGWKNRLPADPAALWAFVSSADQDTLLALLALTIAPGIDLRRSGPLAGMDARLSLGEQIAELAELDMSAWWSASNESYFEHVRKDVLIDAIKEVQPTLDRSKLEKASKAELLARAKKAFKKTAWLPEELRSHQHPVTAPMAVAAE